jgi:hypothetical protein
VEEDDEKSNVCYCVESKPANDELLYSSHSKASSLFLTAKAIAPLANGEGADLPRKAKAIW